MTNTIMRTSVSVRFDLRDVERNAVPIVKQMVATREIHNLTSTAQEEKHTRAYGIHTDSETMKRGRRY